VRKLLVGLSGLLLAGACTTRSTVIPASSGLGGAGPRPALDAFLSAVRAQDLQALSNAWGDKDGPVRDSKRIGRDEVERRELLLMCFFRNDKYRVLSESPAANGERVMQVELTKGTLTRTTNFYAVQGGDRWFIRTADVEPVRDLCQKK
jgi:hypothetical protein